MAIVPMTKVRCLAHRSVQDALLGCLYDLGVMEAVEVPLEDVEQRRAVSGRELEEVDAQLRLVEETIRQLRTVSHPERSLLGYFFSMLRPKSRSSFEKTRTTFDSIGFCAHFLELKKARESLSKRRKALLKELRWLEPLQEFTIPLGELRDSKWTVIRLIQGPGPLNGKLLPKEAALVARRAKGPVEWVVLACPRGRWPELEAELSAGGWTVVDISGLSGTPQEELSERQRALGELEAEIERNQEALEKAAGHLDELLVVYDWLLNERDRLVQMRRFTATDATVLLEGWAKAESADVIASAVKPYAGSAVLSLLAPAAGERVPIILDNPSWLKPFEFVTRMYGLPRYGQVDPTPWLAPFFLLFFSLCLTDAAYGFVLAGLSTLVLWRGGITGSSRRLVKLLGYGGLVTVLSGALAGGWFGNILMSLPGPLKALGAVSRKMVVLDPMQNVLLFMGVIFVLGYFQVSVGILIKMGHKMREGRVAAALIDEAVWLVFLNGLVAWGVVSAVGRAQTALPAIKATVVMAGAIRVLAYGRDRANWAARMGVGLASLYQAIGVMSDVLSYARVVALGLATGVIALVVDTLCVMTAGLPWVGLIVAFFIFVIGHSFNIIINVIGAFVHTGRLQFVEFFSKFFVAGGPSWRPFRFESRHFALEG